MPKTVVKFNVCGFIFSSFYLMYKECSLAHILFFLFLPWLITFAFLWTEYPVGILFLLGFTISHIIVGFKVNDFIAKQKSQEQMQLNKMGKNTVCEYFTISPARLLFFSCITLGIYDIYWAYRQWKAYQKANGAMLSPAMRAFFIDFTLYSLVSKMLHTLNQKTISVKFLALLYMFWNIALSIYLEFNQDNNISLLREFIVLILMLVPSVLICLIHKIIFSEQTNYEKDISNYEALWLIIGFICACLYLYTVFEPYMLWFTLV